MKTKFKDIPVETETKIIKTLEVNLGPYEVVYQKWNWDGITAESIIFFNEDVAELNEQEIKNEVGTTSLLKKDSKMTYSKGEKYTFVNFNFVSE